jgi:hypothetical protein
LRYFISFAVLLFIFLNTTAAVAVQPKSKFYNFNEQLIDGERKKPTILYTNSRQRVKFNRLLKLKKSFLPKLFNSAKERVFK